MRKQQRMKQVLPLLLFLFILPAVRSQVIPPPAGIGQVVRTVGTIGRGLQQAKVAQGRTREQEESDARYANHVAFGDRYFDNGQYEQAAAQYQQALELQENPYPRERLDLARARLGRLKKDPYQLTIDTADSLYSLLLYDAAIERYQAAVTMKPEERYPSEQIARARAAAERWEKIHFSGLQIADQRLDDTTSCAFSDDPWSDFIAAGKYPHIERTLIYSVFHQIDGIAIPPGTRLIVYSRQDYKGTVLLDITGPAIVNNAGGVSELQSRVFTPSLLESTFPAAARTISASDMHGWSSGSMEIIRTTH